MRAFNFMEKVKTKKKKKKKKKSVCVYERALIYINLISI